MCKAVMPVKKNTTGKTKNRANGTGSVYKRGPVYQAEVVVGWNEEKKRPLRKTKSGFKTKKEAYDYIPILRELHRLEMNPAKAAELLHQKKKESREKLTFSQLFDKFIAEHSKRVSKSTLNCYKAAYKYFEPLYNVKFIDLDGEDIQACIDDCPRKRQMKKNMKMVASKLCQEAKKLKISDVDFASAAYIESEDSKKYNPFPGHILTQLIQSANDGVQYADYIVCACYLGFRPVELFNLKVSDYDTIEKCFTGGAKTAAGRDRSVPVSPKIQGFIDARLSAGYEYVFPRLDGHKMNTKFFRLECFYPLLAHLGIQPAYEAGIDLPYKPYSCRHTFATMMKEIKGSDKDKSALMGHTSYEMTLRYQHEDLESKRRIIEQL